MAPPSLPATRARAAARPSPGAGDTRLTVIERVFTAAKKNAPALVFIDELDSIASPRQSAESALLTKLRAVLRQQMDALSAQPADRPVIVVGATSASSSLCDSLLRPGRFERTITLNKPDEEGRRRILEATAQGMKVAPDVDLREVAKRTNGFVGSDLMALCREAGLECVREAVRMQRERDRGDDSAEEDEDACALPNAIDAALLTSLAVRQSHFLSAIALIAPASTRSFTSDIPPLTWASLGGNDAIRTSLTESLQLPLVHSALLKRFNLPSSSSTLLYGPPGCGKTMMAQVIANSYGVAFISVKGPELLSSYLGESERKLRDLFDKARAASPCVIFFDEIDAIATRRGQGNDPTIDRIINTLLLELDTHAPAAAPSPPLLFVIAATNRPELLDPAVLRPGRFDHLLYVPLPDEPSRLAIIQACIRDTPLDDDAAAAGYQAALAERMDGFSGADIAHTLNTARRLAVRDELESAGSTTAAAGKVTVAHVEQAMASARPSVSTDMLERYAYFHDVMQRTGEHRRGDDEDEGQPREEEEEDEKEGNDDQEDPGTGETNGNDEKAPSTQSGLEALRGRIRVAVAEQMAIGPHRAAGTQRRSHELHGRRSQAQGGRIRRETAAVGGRGRERGEG